MDMFDAIVIGSGMSGLALVHSLAKTGMKVINIEKDLFEGSLRSVPQANQGHNLMSGGYNALSELIPNWDQKLKHLNAEKMDWALDTEFMGPYSWHLRSPSKFQTYSVSRAVLEDSIRQQVNKSVDYEMLEGVAVENLILEKNQVKGVCSKQGKPYYSKIVIDCSGRNSAWPKWFEQNSLARPHKEVVHNEVVYASSFIRLPKEPDAKLVFITLQGRENPRGGMLMKVEEDKWMITLYGSFGEKASTETKNYLEFAKKLRHPKIYDCIKDAEFLTPIQLYANTKNRFYHLQKESWPQGFLTLGDALTSFNPAYGLGMTVTLKSVLKLRDLLGESPKPENFDFNLQREIQKVSEKVWKRTSRTDLFFAGEYKPKPGLRRIKKQVMSNFVFRAASYSSFFRDQVLAEMHMVK